MGRWVTSIGKPGLGDRSVVYETVVGRQVSSIGNGDGEMGH